MLVGRREEEGALSTVVEDPRVVVHIKGGICFGVSEPLLVFGAEIHLAHITIGKSFITCGIVAIGEVHAVHKSIAPLRIEGSTARTRRGNVDVAHHGVVPQPYVQVVKGLRSLVGDGQVDQGHEI